MDRQELRESWERERRAAWDQYAAAAMLRGNDPDEAAKLADQLLTQRNERFSPRATA